MDVGQNCPPPLKIGLTLTSENAHKDVFVEIKLYKWINEFKEDDSFVAVFY